MLNTKQFGFVIWGVRNGFNRDILSSDKVAEVSAAFNDSMRQICNDVIDCFYSIEKTANYSLLTVYNPNTTDHVQRKAYIAITLFAKHGTIFNGNVIEMLNSLMSYNNQKQGSAIVNTFTESMFEDQIQNFSAQNGLNNNSIGGKFGYIAYNTIDEIEKYFKSPSIDGYRKVFFYQKAINITLPAEFEKVISFKKYLKVRVANYNAKNYTLFLNGQKLNPIGESNIEFDAEEADTLSVVETNSGRQKQFLVSKQTIDLRNYFPPKTTPAPDIYPSDKKNINKKKVILFAIITLLVLTGVYFLVPIEPDLVETNTIDSSNTISPKKELASNNTTPATKDTLNSNFYSALDIMNANYIYKANKDLYEQNPYFTRKDDVIQRSANKSKWEIVTKDLDIIKTQFGNIYFKLINGELVKYSDTVIKVEAVMNDEEEKKSVASFFTKKLGLTVNNNIEVNEQVEKNMDANTNSDTKTEPQKTKTTPINASSKAISTNCEKYCKEKKRIEEDRQAINDGGNKDKDGLLKLKKDEKSNESIKGNCTCK